ncbi:zinc ion binding protein [Artemisia annua]|uniref:Zinc ion binding protein n=1 Tax=Artemisia annua TaxID=35608 RepID=A0A2U1L8S4_ARTAN|nr:zinc ion binding protein [Artemisia annua]
MVWFQCEDCGDNLKKPKLPNHFRSCSATKLSCIDCGQMFGQQTVQSHTQCISETEKYGPKGLNKPSNGTPGKPNSAAKPKPEVDINVGLSQRPPWFCSLCNTSATSQQTLLSHADGKKHRAKARAFHASNQPPKEAEEPTPNTEVKSESVQNNDLPVNGNAKESDASEGKKRKIETVENTLKSADGTLKMRKLQKEVLKIVRESGTTIDEDQLVSTFEHKVNSSSKFSVIGKHVQLVAKS